MNRKKKAEEDHRLKIENALMKKLREEPGPLTPLEYAVLTHDVLIRRRATIAQKMYAERGCIDLDKCGKLVDTVQAVKHYSDLCKMLVNQVIDKELAKSSANERCWLV